MPCQRDLRTHSLNVLGTVTSYDYTVLPSALLVISNCLEFVSVVSGTLVSL